MLERGNLSRRGFMNRSLGGMLAAGLPVWYANEMLAHAQEQPAARRIGPNDRITMAAIGTGTNRTRRTGNAPLRGERGHHIMQDAMRQTGVQMVAVADVDRPNAEFSQNYIRNATQGGSRDARVYSDFRQLLEDRNIDAVTIGTPDHWHAFVAIAAMRAGKDVYCEKPMTLTLAEGKAMVEAARQTGKVVQTGSQQRSDARFRLACELVRNGRIGAVRKITTMIGDNPQGGPFAAAPVPEGLDWNFWLGPTPQVDYTPNRCHYEFRWWYDYSGGKMTDWGAHHNDIAQWALGMDQSGPATIRATAQPPQSTAPNSFNCHRDFEVVYRYNNGANGAPGTELYCRANRPAVCPVQDNNGVLFEGEEGKWIFVSRGRIAASAANLISDPLPATATRLQVSTNHMGNFIECLRSRQQPICNVNVGHRSVSVCHLGVIATRFFQGQTITWNPEEQRFTGEHAEAANRHLSRPIRGPWRLEA